MKTKIGYLILFCFLASGVLAGVSAPQGTVTTSTKAPGGEWTSNGTWMNNDSPDPTKDKCILTFDHNVVYNPTGSAPFENPFEWKNNVTITVKAGVTLTFNSSISAWNNFTFVVENGGRLVINGDMILPKNGISGTVDGEVHVTGMLDATGGTGSVTGTGSIVVDGEVRDPNGIIASNLISGISRYLIVDGGNWSNPASWSPVSGGAPAITAPNSQCDVYIESGYDVVVDATASARVLTIAAGCTLRVNAGKTLTVGNNIANSGEIYLLGSPGGSVGALIFNGAAAIPATVKKYLTGGSYQYLSSPLSAVPASTLTSSASKNLYGYYEPSTSADFMDAWQKKTSGSLENGTGYAFFPAASYTVSFGGGNLVNQDKSVHVTYSSTAGGSKGYNLIGNPFPCNISADAFINANDDAGLFTGALYFWDDDNTSGLGYSSADYLTYTKGGGTTNGPNGAVFNGYIAPMQAFFIEAMVSGDMAFTSAMKTTNNGNFVKSAIWKEDLLELSLARLSVVNPNQVYNELLIKFADDATAGRDIYDGAKVKGNEYLAFYSVLDDKPYAIQGLPMPVDTTMVSLGLESAHPGIHTLELIEWKNFDVLFEVYLIDNQLDSVINLRQASYLFSHQGTDTSRFDLMFVKHPQTVTRWLGERGDDFWSSDNWDNGLPDECKTVVIGSMTEATLSTGLVCRDLIVEPSACLYVVDGGDIAASNEVLLLADNSGRASLADMTGKALTGRYELILPAGSALYTLASPLKKAYASVLGSTEELSASDTDAKALYDYSFDEYQWRKITDGNMRLFPGEGYLFRNSASKEARLIFEGEFNTLPDVFYLNDGFSFVGNPYPSALYWGNEKVQSGWESEAGIGTSVWTKQADGRYGAYNRLLGKGTNGANGIIPPLAAFWVHSSDFATLEVDATAKTSCKPVASAKSAGQSISVILSDGVLSDEFLLAVHPDALHSLDEYDTYAFSPDPEFLSPLLYAELENNRLAIDAIPEINEAFELKLSANLPREGTYSLMLSASGIDIPNKKLYVEDVDAQQIFEAGQLYSFEASQGIHNDRFRVWLADYYLNSGSEMQGITIFSSEDRIWLKGNIAGTTLQVLDISGRIVLNQPTDSQEMVIVLDRPAGYYVVRLIHPQGGLISRKLFVGR